MSDEGKLRPDIADAWVALRDHSGLQREIESLHERLDEGETVSRIIGTYREGSGTHGLLVLTGRRLFFYAKGRGSSDYYDIPWEPGTPVNWSGGWLTGKIIFPRAHGDIIFVGTDKTSGEHFVDTLRTHSFTEPTAVPPAWYAISAPQYAPPGEPAPAPSPEETIISSLERLGSLYERGILDEAEFARAKADLLARLSGERPAE